MRILWSPQAREDLRAIILYIAEENPYAAGSLQSRIKKQVKHLVDNPHIGRPGRVPGTRELVITTSPYIVPYRVLENRLEVLRVYHGARRWPETFSNSNSQAYNYFNRLYIGING
jgi:addiction module RelE/StbE family toxin